MFIDYLFFSEAGVKLRRLIAGKNFDAQAWENNPLLVPNGRNEIWRHTEMRSSDVSQSVQLGGIASRYTFCPNFLDSFHYMRPQA